MKKGKLIGKGMTAEVYKCDDDKVLKLYYDWVSKDYIYYEAEVCKAIDKIDISSPAIYKVLNQGNRIGITFQHIHGKSMLKLMEKKPWMIFTFARQMARLQTKIHINSIGKLKTQEEIFRNRIIKSSNILRGREKRIVDYLESLPSNNNICHGDFHPDNIIVTDTEKQATIIDWANAYSGSPLSDVARTCIIITSPFMPSDTPKIIIWLSKILKKSLYSTYIKEYIKLSKVKLKDIDAWMLPVAAVRLSENIPGEEKWLLDIIDNKLKLLNG